VQLETGETVPVQCQSLDVDIDIDLCDVSIVCAPYAEVCVDGGVACVHTCPSFIYEDEEYHAQWLSYIVPGLIGNVHGNPHPSRFNLTSD
jgi:hypothetical protein